MSLSDLSKALCAFRDERDWAQFHSPKNLAMAISVECSELLEHFQWLTEAQSKTLPEDIKSEVAYEMADVLNYLLLLADQLNVDLLASAKQKIALNAKKYPADQAKGSAAKYTAYQE